MMNSLKWTCYNENKAPLNITVNTFIGTQDFHYQFYTFLHSVVPSVASSLTHTTYTGAKEYEKSSVSLLTANKIVEENAPVLIKVSLAYKGVTYSGNRVLALGYTYADGKYTFTNPTFTSLKNVCLEIMHNYLPRAAECDTVNMISFDVMSDAQIDALSKTGTFVYEDGVYQPEWNADTKANKEYVDSVFVKSQSQYSEKPNYGAYTFVLDGDIIKDSLLAFANYPQSYALAQYDSSAKLYSETPLPTDSATTVANKAYVDGGFVNKLQSHEGEYKVYANMPYGDGYYFVSNGAYGGTLAERLEGGQLAVGTPIGDNDATNKQYVDKNSYAVVTINFALPDMLSTESVAVAVPRKIGSLVVTYLPTSASPETICYTNLQFDVGLNNENQWEVSMARATWWSAADSKMEFYEWVTPTKVNEPTPTSGEFQYNITEGV